MDSDVLLTKTALYIKHLAQESIQSFLYGQYTASPDLLSYVDRLLTRGKVTGSQKEIGPKIYKYLFLPSMLWMITRMDSIFEERLNESVQEYQHLWFIATEL